MMILDIKGCSQYEISLCHLHWHGNKPHISRVCFHPGHFYNLQPVACTTSDLLYLRKKLCILKLFILSRAELKNPFVGKCQLNTINRTFFPFISNNCDTHILLLKWNQCNSHINHIARELRQVNKKTSRSEMEVTSNRRRQWNAEPDCARAAVQVLQCNTTPCPADH